MEKLIVKEYNDFDKIVNILKRDNSLIIDLCELDNKLKIRIIDLVVGYVHDSGRIKKESATSYIISLGK